MISINYPELNQNVVYLFGLEFFDGTWLRGSVQILCKPRATVSRLLHLHLTGPRRNNGKRTRGRHMQRENFREDIFIETEWMSLWSSPMFALFFAFGTDETNVHEDQHIQSCYMIKKVVCFSSFFTLLLFLDPFNSVTPS